MENRINEAIEERGLTARQFNRSCGFYQQQSFRYRSGDRTPGPDEMERMCRALRHSAGYLYGFDYNEYLPICDGHGQPTGQRMYAPADKVPDDAAAHWEPAGGFSAFGVSRGAYVLVAEGGEPEPGMPGIFRMAPAEDGEPTAHFPAHLSSDGAELVDDRPETSGVPICQWPTPRIEFVGAVTHYQAPTDWPKPAK